MTFRVDYWVLINGRPTMRTETCRGVEALTAFTNLLGAQAGQSLLDGGKALPAIADISVVH